MNVVLHRAYAPRQVYYSQPLENRVSQAHLISTSFHVLRVTGANTPRFVLMQGGADSFTCDIPLSRAWVALMRAAGRKKGNRVDREI